MNAKEFMLGKVSTWNEWLSIGDPRSNVRILECIRRYPKPEVRQALIETCMDSPPDPTKAGKE